MGIDYDYRNALTKALIASGMLPPSCGGILLSIADPDKPESRSMIQRLIKLGYKIYATEGTARLVQSLGDSEVIIARRLGEGYPNVVDVVRQGMVDAVVNTTVGGGVDPIRDGFQIRRAAVELRIPCFTSIDTAGAAIQALAGLDHTYSVERRANYLSRG